MEHPCLRFTFIVSPRHFDQRYSVIFQPEFSSRFIDQACRPLELLSSSSQVSPKCFLVSITSSLPPQRVKAFSFYFFKRCPLFVLQLISHHCSSSTVSAGSFDLIILVVSSDGPGLFRFERRSVRPPEMQLFLFVAIDVEIRVSEQLVSELSFSALAAQCTGAASYVIHFL